MKFFFLLLLIVSSVHAGVGLDEIGSPMIKCNGKAKNEVTLFAYSEGVAGIRVLGKDYILDTRLNQVDAPEASLKVVSSGDVEVDRIFYKKEWSIDLKMFTAETYVSNLTVKGKKIPLTCKFGN